VTAATQAHPVPAVSAEVLAAQWERLGHWFNQGPADQAWDDAVWKAVDALAPRLPEEERTNWFEQVYAALAVRDGDVECPPGEDPDVVEQVAAEAVDEAVQALIGGCPR
jgi:hypothetical protein